LLFQKTWNKVAAKAGSNDFQIIIINLSAFPSYLQKHF